jgi:hypothetical protein
MTNRPLPELERGPSAKKNQEAQRGEDFSLCAFFRYLWQSTLWFKPQLDDPQQLISRRDNSVMS